MERTPLVVGNWKMHKTTREAAALVEALKPLVAPVQGVDIVLCPPFTALQEVGRFVAGTALELGAQNMHWEPRGPFTGEVAAPMLWELGCTYVILGHSERRAHFGETDEMVRRKVAAAFANELIPILCVGETLEERDAGRTEAVVARQLRAGVEGIGLDEAAALVVAYEPVWAIGTGRPATGQEGNRMAGLIRGWLAEWFGEAAAAQTRVLYGGSLTPDNAAEFFTQPEVDGGLVGGASLEAESFARIVLAAVPAL